MCLLGPSCRVVHIHYKVEVSHWPFSLVSVEPSIEIPEFDSAEASKTVDIVYALHQAQCSETPVVGLQLSLDCHMINDASRLVFATHDSLAGLLNIYAESLETDSLWEQYQRKRAARRKLSSTA